MKEYIKPKMTVVNVAPEPMMAASPEFDTSGIGSANADNMSASKNHKPGPSLWDETWDDDDDESNE